MTAQWSERQIHDTVAAIVKQLDPAGGQRESLFGRLVRFVMRQINDLLDWFRGSLDARILVFAAIGVVVLAIVARVVAERRAADRRHRGIVGRGARGQRRDRWAASRELAAAGRYADASHELYAATLEVLAASGLVRYHASKTNGDYARELRRAGSPIAAEFRAFGREFDRAVFGSAETTADEYASLRERSERIVDAARRRTAA